MRSSDASARPPRAPALLLLSSSKSGPRPKRKKKGGGVRTGLLWLLPMAGSMIAPQLISSVTSAAQSYAMQQVQSLFVGSLMSMATVGAMNFGSQLLMQSFGAPTASGLVGAVQGQALSAFQSLFSSSSATTTPPPPMKPDPWLEQRLKALEAQGAASTAMAQIAALAEHKTAMALVVLGSFLSYLHYVGAMEFRRQLSRDPGAAAAAALPPPLMPATTVGIAEQVLQGAGDDPQRDDKDLQRLRSRLARAVEHLHHRHEPAARAGQEEQEEDSLLSFDVGGRTRRWLHQLYTSDPYYLTPVDVPGAAYVRGEKHPVRMLVNVFLGFVLQLSSLLGLGEEEDGAAERDPVHATAQVVSLVAYWEVFVYALRLYGWGPVSAAVTCVVRLLMGSAASAGARAHIKPASASWF